MADYGKKKNDELAALCKERGLAHTGKKADLVKRLEEHDESNATGEKAAPENTVEGKNTSTDVEAPEADTQTRPEQPANEETSIEQLNTETTEEKAPPKDFTLGLQQSSIEEEIEKRKKRAAKFGLDISNDETLKQLERAKRFGTTNVPGLLDQALPERAERGKKRGREAKEGEETRKRSKQRPAKESEVKQTSKKTETKSSNGEYPSWMTASDREAADKRKAKFTPKD